MIGFVSAAIELQYIILTTGQFFSTQSTQIHEGATLKQQPDAGHIFMTIRHKEQGAYLTIVRSIYLTIG